VLPGFGSAVTIDRDDKCGPARWARRHPLLVALASGAAVAGWCNVVTYNRALALGVGAGTFLLQLILWMPGGPARRYTDRVCGPSDEDHA
jgi:hypothetical protein